MPKQRTIPMVLKSDEEKNRKMTQYPEATHVKKTETCLFDGNHGYMLCYVLQRQPWKQVGTINRKTGAVVNNTEKV
jgi:hypothetical protein